MWLYTSVIVAVIAVPLFFAACIDNGSQRSDSQNKHTQLTTSSTGRDIEYNPPATPAIIATEKERMEYMALNYWRDFDFRDTTAISSPITEKAFARYIQLLQFMPLEIAQRGMTTLMESSSQDSLIFNRFIEIGEKYLYDPNSPIRNEELYIPILRYIIASNDIDEWSKIRPQHQLDMALKNRVGERATDFTITLIGGEQSPLSQIDAEYIILLFNNPDCQDCIRVKSFIIDNRSIFSKATVVSIYVDSDIELWRATEYPDDWINGYDKGELLRRNRLYDLKAIPTLYLLDREHRIILKDASIEAVAQYLFTI
ncbi:MAG: DUF5106 domain-containing protein [Rikenellaceae bacterium]